jgi:PKHD-type hydroxylase
VILCIGDVLDAEHLARARKLLESGNFVDGRATSHYAARVVKNNLQLVPTCATHAQLCELILSMVRAHPTFRMAALPRKLRPPLISRSEASMGYGLHVDDAIMGTPPTRADMSYTLFLSAPTEYEGGELVIEDALGEHSFKLDAGSLVLYPATHLHRVATVRSGLRLVAAGWVQSLCRSVTHREILFDLQRAMRAEFDQRGKTAQFDLLSKSYSNLLRLFAEV